jgi:hypothetical protein
VQSTRRSNRVAGDVREIKTRVGLLEQRYASVSSRIDRIESRLERIDAAHLQVVLRLSNRTFHWGLGLCHLNHPQHSLVEA